MFDIPNAPNNTSVTKGAGPQMMDVGSFDPPRAFALDGNDNETRPQNMYMDYIIKTSNDRKKNTAGVDLLAGSVFPFAGADNVGPRSSIPGQYIACNDHNAVLSQYPDLQIKVGNRFSSTMQAKDSFTPPNLMSYFIRGIDDAGICDPDVSHREYAPDGSQSGRGTTQKWATKLRNPHYMLNALNQGHSSSSGCMAAAGTVGVANNKWTSDAVMLGGEDETRPTNVAVQFYLNGIGPSKDKHPNIPIGGIVAIPGIPDTSSFNYNPDLLRTWLPCKGGEAKIENYSKLADIFKQSLWNNNQTVREGYFLLPDLRGQYLRGANPATGRPTASRQDWATGRPANLGNQKGMEWPSDPVSVGLGGGNRVFDALGDRKFDIQVDWWDNETAPVTWVVDYYVRAW
jgi:hypothetical protein